MRVRVCSFVSLVFSVAVGHGSPAHAQKVESGSRHAPLVELYTSEGCSSCPPAEAWLRAEDDQLAAAAAIVIELHVDYWDEIGWPDPFASPHYTQRQRALAQRNGGSMYTPELAVDGREARREGLGAALAPRAAPLPLSLEAHRQGTTLTVTVAHGETTRPVRMYVAVLENGLSVDVLRGENAGRRLRHEHVLRTLRGPYSDKRVVGNIELARTWRAEQLELVAFAEDESSGEVLQAVRIDKLQ